MVMERTNTIREFVETIGVTTSYVANPTLLQQMATLPVAGGIGYQQINSQNVQTGIGTDDRYEFYSFLGTFRQRILCHWRKHYGFGGLYSQ